MDVLDDDHLDFCVLALQRLEQRAQPGRARAGGDDDGGGQSQPRRRK
jgi:hypothetical protein